MAGCHENALQKVIKKIALLNTVAITARMARNSFCMARIPADYICRNCIKGWPVKKFLRKQFLSEQIVTDLSESGHSTSRY
jgi:hypothetical protein